MEDLHGPLKKPNKTTGKDHFPLLLIDQMLDKLVGHKYYCFSNGYSWYNQIAIMLEDQENTIFICLYGTFVFKRMPSRLYNTLTTFQRSMMTIFSNMCKLYFCYLFKSFILFRFWWSRENFTQKIDLFILWNWINREWLISLLYRFSAPSCIQ